MTIIHVYQPYIFYLNTLCLQDVLGDNVSLFAEKAEILMNRQKKLSAKIKVDMERRETNQLLSFQDKLAKRKDARMKKLKEKQETEKVKN